MKAFLAAVAVMVVITVAAPYALQQVGFSAAEGRRSLAFPVHLTVSAPVKSLSEKPSLL